MRTRFIGFHGVVLALAMSAQAETPTEDESAKKDEALARLALEPEVVAKGEAVFKTMCFACHGMQLEGAAGPNLRDATWIHGSKPTDILNIINKGVSEKGMMAYELIYDEATREALVALILSAQEGLRNVRYEVHPPMPDPETELPRVGRDGALKSGRIEDALIDLSPAEMEEFSMAFRGDFIAPKSGVYEISGQAWKTHTAMWIDGEEVSRSSGKFRAKLELKAGTHEMEFAVQGMDRTPRTLQLDYDGPVTRNVALSRDSHQLLLTRRQEFTPVDHPLVVRTVLDGVPHESVAVGLPGGVHLALGRDGGIHAVWGGLFLDIGPNVSGRGRESAKVPRSWFHSPDSIRLLVDGEPASVRLREYEFGDGGVTFRFSGDGLDLTIDGFRVVEENQVAVDYEVGGADGASLALTLPARGAKVRGGDGEVREGRYLVGNRSRFTLVIGPDLAPGESGEEAEPGEIPDGEPEETEETGEIPAKKKETK